MAAGSELEDLRAQLAASKEELKALSAEQRWTRQLLETVPAVVMRLSLDGVIEHINRVLPEYEGRPPPGQSIFSFAPADQHERMRAALQQARESLKPSSFESLAEAPDGTRDWYLTTVGPMIEDGRLVGFAMVSANASRLRRAEASLEESRAKMQLALDAGNVGVWRWDLATDEVAWDEKLDAMFGLTPDQSPRTVAQYMALIPEDQKPAMRAHIARALETGHYPDFELRADRSGGTRWFIIKGGVLRDTAGKVTALLGGVIDATERRHTEERLRQSQKLEAVGQLAAGVAHNFNNMLAVILASLEMLKTQPGYPNPALLEDALVSATNAAELVRQLMVFSRSQPDGGQRTEPLSEVVRRSVQLCAQTFDRSIALELGPLELAGSVKVDSGPMEQAVVNLLLNARDALPGTGRPGRIEVSVVALGSAMRALHPDAEGPWVELRVRDNGQGMSAATRARMLEPFFTTKGARSGTGLGLSTVWATVRAHQGFLECESEPGKGTTFSVILPAQASPVATLAPNHRAPGAVGAGAAVLIVDDQDAVRRAHEVLLRAAGFTVLTAASGAEAIAAAAGAPIDVVLLDYSMPGLSAEETLRGLRTTRPGLPVVCLSGLGATLEGATAQLTKPVSQEVLVGTLLRALEPK